MDLEWLEPRMLLAGGTTNLADFIASPVWEPLGPISIEGGTVEGIPGRPVSGALQAVAIHPTDPNILLVGSVNGGIWRTRNAQWPSDGINNNAADELIGIADGTDWPSLQYPLGDGIIDDPDPGEAVVWEPVGDDLASLSISSIAFSRVDPQVVYAGIGALSSFGLIAPPVWGLYKSTSGGDPGTWAHLASTAWGTASVAEVLPVEYAGGEVALVATTIAGGDNTLSQIGLYYNLSVNGDTVWQRESAASGTAPAAGQLPFGAVSDLLIDPVDLGDLADDPDPLKTTVYAAVHQQGVFEGILDVATGLFDSWTLLGTGLPPQAQIGKTLLAMFGSSIERRLYAAVASQHIKLVDVPEVADEDLIDVFEYDFVSGDWSALGPVTVNDTGSPGLHNNHDAGKHFSFMVDPENSNRVFIGGDRQPRFPSPPSPSSPNVNGATAYSGNLFVGDVSQPIGSRWSSIVARGASGTSPHADSRGMIFDWFDQSIIQVDDGGIYRLLNPTNLPAGGEIPPRHWISLNGNLAVNEITALAYDAQTDLVVAGSQDNGIIIQSASGSDRWVTVRGGDGVAVAVAPR